MTITNQSSRLVAVAAGVAVALVLMLGASMPVRAAALSQTQIQSILNLLTSFGADQATINNVSGALNGQATSGTGGSTGGTMAGGICPYTWSRSLQQGSTGADVKALQQFLNMSASTMVSAAGAGSPGLETMTFGPATKAAVMKFQTANGISSIGLVGPATRAKLNSLCTGTGTPGVPGVPGIPSGPGLTVSVAATSPNNSVLVSGQGIGDLGEFTFTNPSSAPITVTGVTFHRTGVSNDQTINNVYLYNGVTRLTDSAGISTGTFAFTNAGGLFTVPAMSSFTIAVRADIAASNTSGQQIGVSLTNVAASGSVASTLPVTGGYQTISSATLATVDFGSGTLPSGNTTISPQADYPIWQNTIAVSTNAVWLKSMRFTNLGSIDAAAVNNLRLYVDGTQVGTAVPSLAADRSVTFDFSSNPLNLATQSHVVKVLGDVVGGASRTIQFSLQRSSDAMFVDSQLSQPILPTNSGSTFSAITPAGVITVQAVNGSSGVSVTKDPASPVNDVSVGSSNVTWASFDFLASGEPTKVMDLYVYADSSQHNGGLKNGKILVNGAQVGSTKDIGEGSSNKTDFSLGSSLILPAGTVVHVSIVADAKTSTSTNLSNGETVVVDLASATSNAQGQSSLQSANVPVSDTPGNTVNVTSSSLTASKFSGYSNQTIVAGTSGAKIGSFTLSAGSTEALDVNTIAVSLNFNTGLTNLTLKDHDTGNILGTVITSPAASTNTFSVVLPIAASANKTVDVYADLLSNAVSVTATLKTATSATGHVTGITASVANDVTLQAITVGTGSIIGVNGTNNPVAKNVVGSDTGSAQQVGNFTFSSTNSSYTVKKLLVKIPNGVASAVSSVSLTYKDSTGTTVTPVTQSLVTDSTSPYATATFTGLNFYVPANDNADLNVWVNIPTVTSQNGISGNAVKAYIDRLVGFQALDASGNATTTGGGAADLNSNATTGYGLLIARKSVPTFSASDNASTAAPTSGSNFFRFSITADAAGPVDVDKVAFTVSTTSVTVSSWTLYDENDTSTALNTATDPDSNGLLAITPTQVITVGAGQTKTFVLRAATVGAWGTGKQISVRFASAGSTAIANAAASTVAASYNYVWSDRSAAAHTTSTLDWTNGYLIKNLVNGVYSYTANF